jgi:two-component system response regulator HydG
MGKVLIVEDNETMREGISLTLKKLGHEVLAAENGHAGCRIFKKESPVDFVITDLKMDEMDGMEVLRILRDEDPQVMILMITAYGTVETAVEAMKLGAFDFISKPFSMDELKLKVDRAFELLASRKEKRLLQLETEYFREVYRQRYNFGEIIGKSEMMQNIYRTILKVASGDSSVCIYGESGTGKELIARAIHYNSPRKEKPFIKVNCSAFAETLLESELFGHEKGAFTGALRQKPGRFELADGGTLFLDEIGDMSHPIQLKLLRVLQDKEFERVGGTETIKVDTRILSATNKNLLEEIDKRNFREDLYYRLHVVPIKLPTLRERKEDIPLLVEHILSNLAKKTNKKVKGLSAKSLELIMDYSWPGNIRELENVLEQSLVLSEGEEITTNDMPIFVSKRRERGLSLPEGKTLPEMLENLERQLIVKAFERARGNKSETARILGIKTSALYYKLEKYDIE